VGQLPWLARAAAARWFDRRAMWPIFTAMVRVGRSCGVVALATLCCGRPSLNVALVTVEALRRDALGCYGRTPSVTPALDSLAATSLLFENVQAPRGLTWPSLTSLHTATYPARHGVRRNGQHPARVQPTLATVLADNGYAAGAFLGNMASADHPGFSTVYKGMFPDLPHHRWDEIITREALAWVDSVGEPFLLWVHYVGPHTPYLPSSDPDPTYDGPVTGTVETLSGLTIGAISASPGNLARVRALYQEDVRDVDRQIEALLAGLADSRVLTRTVVVATADHGEELGHHNHYIGHANSIYQAVLGLPLIISLPGGGTGLVREQVEMTDIAPTLLDVLGVAAPSSMQGTSFRPLLDTEAGWEEGPAYSEWVGSKGETVYAVRNGRWKYVHNPGHLRPADVPYCYHPGTGFDLDAAELYDLDADPVETNNVAAAHPEVIAELSGMLQGWLSVQETPPERGLAPQDPETVEELKALGYLR
jgi:arylsulfatase A-like enzyme